MKQKGEEKEKGNRLGSVTIDIYGEVRDKEYGLNTNHMDSQNNSLNHTAESLLRAHVPHQNL